MILVLAFGTLHAWEALRFWLLKRFGLNLYFPKTFEHSARFPSWKFGEKSPYFRGEN